MTTSIPFNPAATTNAMGSFRAQSQGYIQGIARPDPALQYSLSAGFLAATETLPMWGGVAIMENLALSTSSIGGSIQRADTTAHITGFSVSNQNGAMLKTPQSLSGVSLSGGQVNFYRMGSGARIAVACEPSLVSLQGGLVTANVSWDINNQRLQPYNAATATVSVTSITASYSATTGLWTFAVVAAAPSDVGGIGDAINISGVTATGGTAVIATLNANQTVTSFTSNTVFSFQIAAAAGAYGAGVIAGTILLNQTTGALSVKVVDIQVGNSKIVTYDAINNICGWNDSGSCAIILI